MKADEPIYCRVCQWAHPTMYFSEIGIRCGDCVGDLRILMVFHQALGIHKTEEEATE